MIRPLTSLAKVKFPVVLISRNKYKDISETTKKLIFDNMFILKQGSLFDALDITNNYNPETEYYFNSPQILLSNANVVKSNLLVDSNFNIFIPYRLLILLYKTYSIYYETDKYFKVKSFSYYFKKESARPSKKSMPVLCEVEKVAFFVGWSKEYIKGIKAKL